MIRKECNKFSDICDSMSDWYKPLAWVLLFFGSAACTEGPIVPEPEPEPSGFTIHMDEENIVEYQEDEQGIYPHLYTAYLVMENLPADQKILYMGGCYSNGSTEPDLSDYTLIYDYSEHDTFQQWDWESGPLIWNCLALYHLMPGTTYHIRGYVKTDKAEYFSNTMEVRSNFTAPMEETTDAYTIPVIFHLFPDADGSYPVKEWMLKEQLDYANRVYSNYFGIPGQEDTGVRFAPATHAPDGKPLSTPGMIYEKEPVEIDSANAELEDRYVWDMEHALNVWVCPITNVYEDEYSIFAGFSYFPFFDENELLPGCDIYKPGLATGIFLNKQAVLTANSISTFAHEAGHFLGLAHVFGQGGDYCEDTPWYDRNAYMQELNGYTNFKRTDANGIQYYSDNIMDYSYSFLTGITPDQIRRIRYTLQHAYFIPGKAGKEEPATRISGKSRRFGKNPVR